MESKESPAEGHPPATKPPFIDDKGYIAFAPNDAANPKNWPRARRWWLTFATISLAVNSTFASSAPSGTLRGVSLQFGVSLQVAGLSMTLFLLGYCAGPLVFAPLSEFYGRQRVFFVTVPLYVAFGFLCAFSPNLAGVLVGRFLTGTFASVPLSNVPGVLADIWDYDTRGKAMAIFSILIQVGPALGPVVSGFLELTMGWRWTYYVLIMFGAVTAIPLLTVPETYAPIILQRRAREVRKSKLSGYESVRAPIEEDTKTVFGVLKLASSRPWRILFDPISFVAAIYLTFLYTLVYMLFSIYPIIYQQHRGWNAGIGQLPVLTSAIGGILGGFVTFFHGEYSKKKLGLQKSPEDRLVLAKAGGVCFPLFMFFFAWTGNYDWMPWVVPLIGGAGVSACIMIVFTAFTNYLVDTYTIHAASAIAINTVCRSAGAASAPLWTNYMFDALGIGPGGSVIAGVSVLLAVFPFVFYKYGKQIRSASKFASS
ncbi:hypothetical protein JX265_012055 [Neoarthrinium moseri]|uniref:Major facilitator superfamily (MFS) profile domain-containing protein n=1 Tax=Neoarthrinium moseri TaxID=1658444 RepID=A0A9P9WB75_9PEZI|nr:hypothetical protein JX266_010944 [Neoarthrinium moseri]KAI1855972.1 hypothetical protein JX265_012055 [Neoarthrinium moseri]